jgi:hypothetical protein
MNEPCTQQRNGHLSLYVIRASEVYTLFTLKPEVYTLFTLKPNSLVHLHIVHLKLDGALRP